MRRHDRALDALNVFLADVRDGLGPYLAIYLLAVRGPDQGWNEATIGMVITLAAVAGLLAQTPAGALIDCTRHKRAVVIAAAVAVTLACVTLPFIGNFYVIAATQSPAGVAGAVFPPALAAITLGIVGPKAFARRIGRNEAFNHAGNAASAALAAGTAFLFGPVVVFWIMAALAVASIGAMLMIPASSIDDDVARGLAHDDGAQAGDQPSAWQALLASRPLLIFAGLMACFHLANAAMLPTVGQKLTHIVGKDHATSLIAACIVAAQCVMVPVAMLAGTKADAWGRKPLFLLAFGVLALRGFLYTVSESPWWLLSVQLLDGVGAGIFGALFPIVIADLTRGTGRFNVSQGAVATAQRIGAALSASLAGWAIVGAGYSAAFAMLGAIAALGFVGYLILMPETRVVVETRHATNVARSRNSRPAEFHHIPESTMIAHATWLTPLLLLGSNILMTFAWYGHLKAPSWPLWLAVLVSWGIAFFEYCLAVPANRIGYGTFTGQQLKIMQEVITLGVFAVFSVAFLGEQLRWTYFAAMGCLVGAVVFIFLPVD